MTEYNKYLKYDQVNINQLKNIANKFAATNQDELKEYFFHELESYIGMDCNRFKNKCTFTLKQLLAVPNSVAVLTFNEELIPNDDNNLSLAGIARIVYNSDIGLPCIYMMPGARLTTFKHEAIHICQYLLPNKYPLRSSLVKLFLSKEIITAINEISSVHDSAEITKIVAEWVAYKLWI